MRTSLLSARTWWTGCCSWIPVTALVTVGLEKSSCIPGSRAWTGPPLLVPKQPSSPVLRVKQIHPTSLTSRYVTASKRCPRKCKGAYFLGEQSVSEGLTCPVGCQQGSSGICMQQHPLGYSLSKLEVPVSEAKSMLPCSAPVAVSATAY